jgi:N utilization substance protein A
MKMTSTKTRREDEETDEDVEDELETYECPECEQPITAEMTVCPNCGVGLSFEIEEVEEQED